MYIDELSFLTISQIVVCKLLTRVQNLSSENDLVSMKLGTGQRKGTINYCPNKKNLDWSKLKAFADNKIKELKIMFFVFNRVENIEGKGENTSYQHFLLFPQFFQKAFFTEGC